MDDANGLSLGAIPFAPKPRGDETNATIKRNRSSFYGGRLAAGLSSCLENAREAANVVKRLSARGARRRKKAMAWRRSNVSPGRRTRPKSRRDRRRRGSRSTRATSRTKSTSIGCTS